MMARVRLGHAACCWVLVLAVMSTPAVRGALASQHPAVRSYL
jgi:hypothetical protein